MSTDLSRTMAPEAARPGMIRDFLILAKPRISVMVLFTVAVAGLASWQPGSGFTVLVHTMVGLFLVSASGCAVNQYLERYVDWLMPRTANRPLPARRLSAIQVALFGAITMGTGTAWLWALTNWQALAISAGSWFIYVAIYTPMKARTWLNTFVGAVAGAMPVLAGSVAVAEGQITTAAWLLFAVLYIWQFPHFMAIAWLYREDYQAGGLRMASTEPNAARLCGIVAVAFAILLLPVCVVSLWPDRPFQWLTCGLVIALSAWYLAASLQFSKNVNDVTARKLFRVSLIWLPAYLAVLLISLAGAPDPAMGG
jgi:heme o synthase